MPVVRGIFEQLHVDTKEKDVKDLALSMGVELDMVRLNRYESDGVPYAKVLFVSNKACRCWIRS